ncbi:MAG TPA: DUF308 domain-containing protein [Candidatus Binatia bacterium]|nr:DUF308 domain-containing protein [Candidatus Binatia bacterium]
MQEQLEGAAWSLGLWGAVSILFGFLIVAWPGITLKAFLVVLGVYLLASGVVLLIGSLFRRESHWVLGVVLGAISTLAGLYVFAKPGISALAVLTVIALWAIVAGAMQIVAGFEAKKHGWWISLAGLVLLLFGFYIFVKPGNGALAIIWFVGLSFIASGVLSAVAAFKLGGEAKQVARRA